MKAKLAAAAIGCPLVLILFYHGGFLNNALLPGFHVSALLIDPNDSGYGKSYFVVGLAINAAIYSLLIFWLFWMPKSRSDIRRLLTPLRTVCLVLLVLFVEYGRPVSALLYTKWQARTAPEMWTVPIPLTDEPSVRSGGRTFSYFGYEFESPWIEVKRERKMDSVAVLNFSNGASITILDPGQIGDELEAMKLQANKRGTDIKNVFGEEAARSRYAFQSKMFYLTPRDLHIFSTRQNMAGNSVLLLMKSVLTKRIKGGLYSFETPWVRGFQVGGPGKDVMVIIRAFDLQDHEITMYVGAEKTAVEKPSQAEITRILYSLHPVPTSAPTLGP